MATRRARARRRARRAPPSPMRGSQDQKTTPALHETEREQRPDHAEEAEAETGVLGVAEHDEELIRDAEGDAQRPSDPRRGVDERHCDGDAYRPPPDTLRGDATAPRTSSRSSPAAVAPADPRPGQHGQAGEDRPTPPRLCVSERNTGAGIVMSWLANGSSPT